MAPSSKSDAGTSGSGTATAESRPAGLPARATKAMAAKLVVREGEEPWTVADLNEVFAELSDQYARLHTTLEDREMVFAGMMKDAGDGAGHDTADVGATNFERDHEITMMNSERAILSALDAVLGKLAKGTFGICSRCEQPIGKMRVMAFPRATLCMSCKQREERR